MAVPKIIQDIRTLYTENDTQDTNLITHNTLNDAHANRFNSMINTINTIGKYNTLSAVRSQGNNQIVTTSPIPITGWEDVNNNVNFSRNGQYEIETSGIYLSNSGSRSVDGNETTSWTSSDSGSPTITYKLPTALTVSKVKIKYTSSASTSLQIKIQGSNDKSTWIDLYTSTYGTDSLTLTEITLPTTGNYIYYRVLGSQALTARFSVFEFQLSSYMVTSYAITYTLSNLPTTLEDNQRILIETPDIDISGVNVNVLNTRAIDTILRPGMKYELLYKSITNAFYAKEVV